MSNSWQFLIVLTRECSCPVPPSVGARCAAGEESWAIPYQEPRQTKSLQRSSILPVMPLKRSSEGSHRLPKVTQLPGEQGQTRERQWQWPIHWAQPCWKSQTDGCVFGKPGVWWLTDPWAFLTIWFPRTGQSDRFAAKLTKLTECADMWNREDAARGVTYRFMELYKVLHLESDRLGRGGMTKNAL